MIGNRPEDILEQVGKVLSGDVKRGGIPEKWDGHAAERIVAHILGLADH